MNRNRTLILVATILLFLIAPAHAVKVDDICKLKGQRINKLVGMGLVLGLPGTGDGGKYLPAIRPLAATLAKFANPVLSQAELANANNIALVMVVGTVPENGIREGDAIDVQVSSIGAAKGLAGGRLFMTPLMGINQADPTIYAWAEGPVVVEDPANTRVAVVRQGAVMEEELFAQFITNAQVTLVLQDGHSGWATAAAIATIINEAESQPGRLAQIAIALDPKNVVVQLSPQELKNPAGFLSRVLNLEVVLPPTEARVTVNERTGTIIVTGDVEIGPVAISHKGLSIATVPAGGEGTATPGTAVPGQPAAPGGPPSPGTAVPGSSGQATGPAGASGGSGEGGGFVGVDTTKEGSTKLSGLLDALNQLKVPAADRIAIIKMIHRTGKLHAELIIE